jgi:hypothetical protein
LGSNLKKAIGKGLGISENILPVEHTRHCSVEGFILKIMSAISAYSFFPRKPSIKKDVEKTNPQITAQLNQTKLIAP